MKRCKTCQDTGTIFVSILGEEEDEVWCPDCPLGEQYDREASLS